VKENRGSPANSGTEQKCRRRAWSQAPPLREYRAGSGSLSDHTSPDIARRSERFGSRLPGADISRKDAESGDSRSPKTARCTG
jgi:hypothetical protein